MTNQKPNARLVELRTEGRYKLLRECMIVAFHMVTRPAVIRNGLIFLEHFRGRLRKMEDLVINALATEAGWTDDWMMVGLAPTRKA